MNNFDNQAPKPTYQELEGQVRALKRKLTLTEDNLRRAKLIAASQERVEMIFNASLKKEIQFFKLILENSTNILLLFDFDGRFAYASQTFLTKTGLVNFGLISGRHFDDVLKPMIACDNLEKFIDAVNCAVEEKKTITIEDTIDFNFKGTPQTFSILVTPMIDEDGKNTGIMALFNDISEINNLLEEAKRANLAKSDFLANMSHEIRTPLNAVIGMAAIARGSNEIDKIYNCLDKINNSSIHLLGVINDILDMSKIETNHFELFYSEFVFEKMLLRIVDMMRLKMEEKNIEFTIYCDPMIPYTIYSDEQRLAQVVMNLLSNAVKFTPERGKISIRVEVEASDDDQYTLRFLIKDTGIGISEEQKPRLFKAFSQADSSISRKFGGTGLGLTISKNIINMMEGNIWFESFKEQGTTFIFNIKTVACSLNPQIKIERKDVRMLIVDDMSDVLLSFSIYAKKLGIPCTTASSAKEALEILQKQPHNILFVDLMMPEVDGLSFIKQLKDYTLEPMVVTMISSADWSKIEIDAKQLGIKEFISKPILLPMIENVLDKYCDKSKVDHNETFDDYSDRTILLVDDIDINREIIISLLEHTKINIISAENGVEAVEKYLNSTIPIDLIFMDVQMPQMDGYEATRQIRLSTKDLMKQVPIVAMTANVFKEDIERCLASGMNDHIGKPIDVEEIFAKLKYWITY